ncbi:unnamed protein product [Closterium sp. Naga37s-1]|nr:unnamed protein product [Closterium sp. Naga37s-1]
MHLDLSGQFGDEETVDVEGASRIGSAGFFRVASHRAIYIHHLLSFGFSVLYSDIDIAFLHNPLPFFQKPDPILPTDAASASAFDAHTNDLDFDLFLSFDRYKEQPSPYTEPIDPYYLNGDRTFCTCLLFFRPTLAAKSLVGNWAFRLAKLGRQGGMDQTQFNLVMQWMHQRKVLPRIGVLPPLQFPSGQLMAQHWEEFEEVQPRVVMVHANYLTGKEAKIKGLKKAGLWRVKVKEQGNATVAGSAASVARVREKDEGARMVGVGIEESSTGSRKEGKDQTRVGSAGGRGGEREGGWEARVLAAVEPWVGEHLQKMEEGAMGVVISAGLVIVARTLPLLLPSPTPPPYLPGSSTPPSPLIHLARQTCGCDPHRSHPTFPYRPLVAPITDPSPRKAHPFSPSPRICRPGVAVPQLARSNQPHSSSPCRPLVVTATLPSPTPSHASPPHHLPSAGQERSCYSATALLAHMRLIPSLTSLSLLHHSRVPRHAWLPTVIPPTHSGQELLFRNWLNHITRIPSLGSAILASVPPQMRTPGGHVITRSHESVSPRVARATCLLLPPLLSHLTSQRHQLAVAAGRTPLLPTIILFSHSSLFTLSSPSPPFVPPCTLPSMSSPPCPPSDINSLWLRDPRPYFPPSHSLVLPSLSHQDQPQQQQQQQQQAEAPATQGAQGAAGKGMGNGAEQEGEGGGSTRKAEAPAIQSAEGAAEKGQGNSTEQQVGEGRNSTQQAEPPATQEGERAADKEMGKGMEQMGEGEGSTQQAEAPTLHGAHGAAEKGLGNSTEKVGEGGGSTQQAEAPALPHGVKGLQKSTEKVGEGEGGGSTQLAEAPSSHGAHGAAEKGLGNRTEQVGEGGGSTQQAEAPAAQRAEERELRETAENKGGSSTQQAEPSVPSNTTSLTPSLLGSTQQAAAPAPPNTTALVPSFLGSLSPWLMALRPSPAVQAMVHRWADRALRGYQIAEAAREGGSGVFSGPEVLKRALNNAVAEMVREARLVGVEEDGRSGGSAGGLDLSTGAGMDAGRGGGTGDTGEEPRGASVVVLPEQLFPPGWKVVGDRAWLEAHRKEIVAVQVSCGEDSRQQEVCLRDMNFWL